MLLHKKPSLKGLVTHIAELDRGPGPDHIEDNDKATAKRPMSYWRPSLRQVNTRLLSSKLALIFSQKTLLYQTDSLLAKDSILETDLTTARESVVLQEEVERVIFCLKGEKSPETYKCPSIFLVERGRASCRHNEERSHLLLTTPQLDGDKSRNAKNGHSH